MNNHSLLPKPLPMSARISFFYAEYGHLEMDGHSVVLRQGELLTHLPIGNTCVVVIMPGTVVTHAAVKACAEEGTMLLWTGEYGVRCYAAGNPGGANAKNLLHQAALRLDAVTRLVVARKIFWKMFNEKAPAGRSIEQLRGIEGGKVKALYQRITEAHGVEWRGRSCADRIVDEVNQAISHANAALYGLTEAVVLALGYSPAIGFVHSGDPRSFVFDVADCIKFSTITPMAMMVVKESGFDIEGRTRRACRDLFMREKMAETIVTIIQDLMNVETCHSTN